MSSPMRIHLGQLEILIDNDPAFSFGSSDNTCNYDREYRIDDEPYRPSSLHSVRTISPNGGTEISSCILGATGGASGIHKHSAIIHGDVLLIAVGPFIASLELPTLELKWKTQTDDATCFGVYHSIANRCYISHGEIDIARVSYDGAIDWTNSGADIFTNGFTLTDQCVEAVDWNEDVYTWDIRTGKPVATTPNKAVNPSGGSDGF